MEPKVEVLTLNPEAVDSEASLMKYLQSHFDLDEQDKITIKASLAKATNELPMYEGIEQIYYKWVALNFDFAAQVGFPHLAEYLEGGALLTNSQESDINPLAPTSLLGMSIFLAKREFTGTVIPNGQFKLPKRELKRQVFTQRTGILDPEGNPFWLKILTNHIISTDYYLPNQREEFHLPLIIPDDEKLIALSQLQVDYLRVRRIGVAEIHRTLLEKGDGTQTTLSQVINEIYGEDFSCLFEQTW